MIPVSLPNHRNRSFDRDLTVLASGSGL